MERISQRSASYLKPSYNRKKTDGYVPPVTVGLCLKQFLGDEVRSPEGGKEKHVPLLGESIGNCWVASAAVR